MVLSVPPLVSKAIEKYNDEGLCELMLSAYSFAGDVPPLVSFKLRRAMIKRKYETVSSSFEYTWVDPKEIQTMLLENQYTVPVADVNCRPSQKKGKFPLEYTGSIIDGDWDLQVEPYEEDLVYNSLRNLFVDDVPWKQTELGRFFVEKANANDLPDEFVDEQLQKREKLYESMKENGFQVQVELSPTTVPLYPPITVNVGRDGELIFNNTGHHRLALSKLLNIGKIPTLIIVQHKKSFND